MRTFLLFIVFISLPAWAEPAGPANGERSKTERWADRCTNFTTTTWAFKAPENFLKWLDAYSDPAIYVEYARRSMDPDYALRSAETLLDAGTVRNFLEWGDPAIPEKWVKALAQPDFYTQMNALLFDPGRMMRWAMLPTNPKVWQVATTALNPETWAKWLALPANPRLAALIAKAQDPMTAEELQRELADRSNYPFLTPIPPDQQRP
jgi:hypothetical protein